MDLGLALQLLEKLSEEIRTSREQAAPFAAESYSVQGIASACGAIRNHYPSPEYNIRAAVFSVGYAVWKPFLEVNPEEVQTSLQTNIASAFTKFSRKAILSFKENDIENGKRGILIFTGATASLRGDVVTSAIATGKHGLRVLS
ncbi:uncharacterized protein LACBIDRAFT_302910 [Laccaria bicolor S238N-H82]|uniref:Predicted protein n=1 Tax=Laccaria bicolor (strain S238N-H82 / ATCC MYA-4686) TaxID=486041 RepID=B0DIL2_LACBS|nr:uncharacterized protein LACBIDRAFT_302910 [Laccaria bicolor S238N-H82]EDR05588.1 predicted protein [Laccaria bicolor S238N-H82]|eukprot:XP_001883692.1 predicted protein [Laccaria bicolor S238N-H82]